MEDIPQLLSGLKNGPQILRHLLAGIPEERLKERRLSDHWTIHEWAAHLCSTQQMLIDRFKSIQEEEFPFIAAHLPDFSKPNEKFLEQELEQWLKIFESKRKEQLRLLNEFGAEDWSKAGNHEEYESFSNYILLRHILLIDNVHFFNIERLWLTRFQYLKK